MKQKKQYIAPELTVVSFKSERGYIASNLSLFHQQDQPNESYNEQSQEKWESGGSLFSGGW